MNTQTQTSLLLLLTCLVATTAARAEDPDAAEAAERTHTVSAGWSPRVMLRSDLIFSPLPAKGGTATGVTLGYATTGRRVSHRASLDFTKSLARTIPEYEYKHWATGETATTEATPFTYARVDYAVLGDAYESDAFTVRVGGAADLDFQAFDWVWHPFAIGGYTGVLALDLRAEAEARLAPDHRLSLSLSSPLAAWVSRSPYAVDDDELMWNNRDAKPVKTIFRYLAGGRPESLPTMQALRAQLRYGWQPTEHWGVSLTLHSRVLHLAEPRPLLAQEHGLTLATTWTF